MVAFLGCGAVVRGFLFVLSDDDDFVAAAAAILDFPGLDGAAAAEEEPFSGGGVGDAVCEFVLTAFEGGDFDGHVERIWWWLLVLSWLECWRWRWRY